MKTKLFALGLLAFVSCQDSPKQKGTPQKEPLSVTIQKSDWGQLPDGTKLDLYTLTNKNGMVVKITNYGGIITHWRVADRDGLIEDIVLGYDSIGGYLKETPYFGALIGRYGNRIANGMFKLDSQTYKLATNNGKNHLHGGVKGFDKVVWTVEELPTEGGLRLTYLSKDGEEGYPGNLKATVTYHMTDKDELKVKYTATTDKPTVVNLTQHTYFNLVGEMRRDILDHKLYLNASRYLPVDKTLIPTGELRSVENSVFDFLDFTRIGDGIDDKKDAQIKFGGGYDHCWVLDRAANDNKKLEEAALLWEPMSGRQLQVLTTEPGIQFYSGNFLDGKIVGKRKTVYAKRYGLCLETQHFPDSPNQPNFPNVVVRPGETYESETVFRLSVKK